MLKLLADSGTSKVVRYLTPDRTLPNIEAASNALASQEDKRRAVFHTPMIVRDAQGGCPHYAYTVPEKRKHYRVLMNSQTGLETLGIAVDEITKEYLHGSKVYVDKDRGIFPYGLAYAGFQFGQFAGQLGDGRVSNLFDILDKQGRYQTVQLKGSGLTPFSRFADGKATLGASIREFIISEALHAIGIPTTRALQISMLPGTRARRSVWEPCAVVARFAPSWIRLGNFDLFRYRGDKDGLLQLTDFCIEHVFSNGQGFPAAISLNLFKQDYFNDEKVKLPDEVVEPLGEETIYDLFFRHVVGLNAECVAYWQAYGFCNGVLNTDNVSILGLSMDFGPFAFMDKFCPSYTPNHDDIEGRYSFENQPSVMWWNLVRLGEALFPLIGAGTKYLDKIKAPSDTWKLEELEEAEISDRARKVINFASNEYKYRFTVKFTDLMAQRLGINLALPTLSEGNINEVVGIVETFTDEVLQPLLKLLLIGQVDYNNFFVSIQEYNGNYLDDVDGLCGLDKNFVRFFFTEDQVSEIQAKSIPEQNEALRELKNWVKAYLKVIPDYKTKLSIQSKVNPNFIPRSYVFEEVIDDLIFSQREALHRPESEFDTKKLKMLYKISTAPYKTETWRNSLDVETIKKWTQGTTEMSGESCMKQCGCSS